MTGSVTYKDRWIDYVMLANAITLFNNSLFDVCVTRVFPRFQSLGCEAEPFRQFLCQYTAQMEEKIEQIRGIVVKDIVDKASKELARTEDIPKQYRWTKKPAPSEANTYLTEAFSLVGQFREVAAKESWPDEVVQCSAKELATSLTEMYLQHARKVCFSMFSSLFFCFFYVFWFCYSASVSS